MITLESLSVGPAPPEANCAQIGVTPDAQRLNKLECQAYIAGLIKHCGAPPRGVSFRVKGNPHEFGTYYEVECRYPGDSPEAADYALKAEKGFPTWNEVRMWPPVTYDGSQPTLVLEHPELWSMDQNPLCLPTIERLNAARRELAEKAGGGAPITPPPDGIAEWGDQNSPFQLAGKAPLLRKEENEDLERLWQYAQGHLGFYGFLRCCDATLMRAAGMGIFDLPDRTWRDSYDARERPRDIIAGILQGGMEE
jgi:hypothetical protein